jgi:hypothetical protein
MATFVLPTLVARPTSAQTPSRNPAAAQALYDEARRLMQAGSYAEACPKFKESYELEPGGGTLLNLADCYDKAGRPSLSWTTFKEALVAAQRDRRTDRIDFANQRIASLERRLARLTVSVAGAARAPSLSVTVDGAQLGEAAWGVALPVDPGRHVVRAEAPGKRPFERLVDLPSTNAARESVEIPRLEDVPAVERPVPIRERPVPLTTSGVAPVESVTKSGSNSRATIGWVVGAVGVASVGVGSYFGLRAINRWSDRNQQCTAGCTPGAKDAGDDANQAATIADIGLGAGLAALAAGTFLVVSGHSAKASAPGETAAVRVAPVALNRGAGLWVQGDW